MRHQHVPGTVQVWSAQKDRPTLDTNAFDEPTGNLDSVNTAAAYERFRDINKRYGTTFVIVTHDRRIAEQTDRIVEIRDGRLLLDISK
jgi:ABC-type lipoprotein export system ATPase subunit